MSLRLVSPLPDAVENLLSRIIGCAISVHRALGPGLSEGIYEDAMTIELEFKGLKFARQREVIVLYRDRSLRAQRLDLVVENQVVVEIKAVEQLHPIHTAQLLSYVRSAKLRVGLLINFNGETIKGNFKRVVN
jgi:GxxExxY protein